jgi:hypothetical protein
VTGGKGMGRGGCASSDGSSGSPPWLPSPLSPTKTSPRTVEKCSGESPWSVALVQRLEESGEWGFPLVVPLSISSLLWEQGRSFFLFVNYISTLDLLSEN